VACTASGKRSAIAPQVRKVALMFSSYRLHPFDLLYELCRCARDVMMITKMRFLLLAGNKRGLLRSPWTKVL
jgi:hypothetical protein